MSRFTTRVELYGDPNYATYNKLHEAMLKGGFSRKIKFDEKGPTYWLPNAEYTSEGTQTPDVVKDVVVKIVATIWTDYGVLVTKTEIARAHHNLKPVD